MDANSVQMILVVVKFVIGCAVLCPLAVAAYRQSWLKIF
jgi:hypothetical protein